MSSQVWETINAIGLHRPKFGKRSRQLIWLVQLLRRRPKNLPTVTQRMPIRPSGRSRDRPRVCPPGVRRTGFTCGNMFCGRAERIGLGGGQTRGLSLLRAVPARIGATYRPNRHYSSPSKTCKGGKTRCEKRENEVRLIHNELPGIGRGCWKNEM